MRTSLSNLIQLGMDNAEISFLAGTPRVENAAALGTKGDSWFSIDAPPTAAAILTNDIPSVALVLAAVKTGARLLSLPLPPRGGDPMAYVAFLKEVCRAHAVETVVARPDVCTLLADIGVPALSHADLGTVPVGGPTGRGFELVQFSSGSTGPPTGVLLDDKSLGANVGATIRAVGPDKGDHVVSWLPLSHDMGLVGLLFTAIASCGNEWVGPGGISLMAPEQFLRSPRLWMDTVSEVGGTFTASPDFGYRLATRAAGGANQLSTLRCAIVGGEIIRPETLDEFVAAHAHARLERAAICPAYGMAEVGLAVSMTSPQREFDRLELVTAQLAANAVELRSVDVGRTQITSVVPSGYPLEGYSVEVDGSAGDQIGNLLVRGPSIGTNALAGHSLRRSDGALETGDLGFLYEGQVVIVGRTDDYFVTSGRNVYAPSVERAIEAVPGVRQGRVATIGLPDGSWFVCVEPETTGTVDLADLRNGVRLAATSSAQATPSEICVVAPGLLPMTSSGKLRRNETRAMHLSGALRSDG